MNRALRGFLNIIRKFTRACTLVFGSVKMVKVPITPQRLQKAAGDAALKEINKTSLMLKTQVDPNLLECRFVSLDPPSATWNSRANGLFEWRVSGKSATVDG